MSCNSCSNVTLPGVAGPAGAVGDTGPQGSTGVFGGYSIEWQFESAITPAPTTGFLRLNDPTPASVTEIYIDETAKNSVNGANFLASIDDNGDAGNYGLIRIFKRGSSTIFWTGKVTASVDSGDYYTLTVTHISSSGTFTANDDVVVSFVANGKTGTIGIDGVSILHYDVAQGTFSESAIGTTNQTTAITKRSFIIPENTWQNAGDMVEVELMMIGETYESFSQHNVYLELDGNPIEIDYFNTVFGAPGYAGFSALHGPLIHLKTQLILTDVATKNIIPITDFESKPGVYSILTSDIFIGSKESEYNFNHRGASTNPSTALDAAMNLKVSAASANSSVNVNMFYAKITKYKKS